MTSELCSGDMLLESLVACFGVTVRAVATSMGIPVEGGSITAQGDLDFRGTMGVKAEDGSSVAVGFQKIVLVVRLDVDEEHKSQVDKLISLSERYCVVLQTLRAGVTVETQLGHVGKAVPDVRPDRDVHSNTGAETNGGGKEDEPVLGDEEVLQLN